MDEAVIVCRVCICHRSAGRAQGRRIVGTGDGEGDQFAVRQGGAIVVCGGDGEDQHQSLVRGQIVKGLAAGVEGPGQCGVVGADAVVQRQCGAEHGQ